MEGWRGGGVGVVLPSIGQDALYKVPYRAGYHGRARAATEDVGVGMGVGYDRGRGRAVYQACNTRSASACLPGAVRASSQA